MDKMCVLDENKLCDDCGECQRCDLDPRDTYADVTEWETKAQDLAGRFVKNFVKYTGNDAGKALVSAGPQL